MDENEFEFEETPELQAFQEYMFSLLNEGLNRDRTLVVNPATIQKIHSAIKTIQEMKWEEPPEVKLVANKVSSMFKSADLIICTLGNVFTKEDKTHLIKLFQIADEVDISGADTEGKMSIALVFNNYFIEVNPN